MSLFCWIVSQILLTEVFQNPGSVSLANITYDFTISAAFIAQDSVTSTVVYWQTTSTQWCIAQQISRLGLIKSGRFGILLHANKGGESAKICFKSQACVT